MSIFNGIFCRHRWKETKASGMMGIFTPITWHEVIFECTKCHKQMHWKKDFSDSIYDKIKQGEFSTRELKRIFHKPIVFNIPIFKIKLTKKNSSLNNRQMIFAEGDVLLQTKSGARLEVRNGGLYTDNRQAIEQALEEDLRSDNPMDVQMAESICMLMQKYGLVAEAN